MAYFHSSKYISDLANGNVCVTIGYSGDIYQAKSRAEEAGNGVNVGYQIPKEGAGSFFDMLAIPADAKNPEAAHVFLNYLLEPQVMAEITNYVQFPNGNAAATPLIDEAIRTDPGIYRARTCCRSSIPSRTWIRRPARHDPQLDQDQIRPLTGAATGRV